MDHAAAVLVLVSVLAFIFWCFRYLQPRLIRAAMGQGRVPNGVAARAEISAVDQTGTYVNKQPECRIRLRIEPEGAAPFEATAKQVVSVSQIPQLQPGAVVTARFDPNDHSQVTIQSLGFQEIPTEEAQRMLGEADALEKRLNNVGTPATAIVTAFKPVGIDFNGPNPLAHVEIKVLPEGGEPYDAVIVGVFAQGSLDKYAAGRTIHVRYDPADPKQVSFDLAKTTTIDAPPRPG